MKLIMSASRATLGAIANHERTMGLASVLAHSGAKFKVALGVFEEDNQTVATEVSFMVDISDQSYPNELAAEMAQRLYDDYQQECILLVGYNLKCHLVYPDDGRLPVRKPEYIGIWTECATRPAGNATQVDGKWYQAAI